MCFSIIVCVVLCRVYVLFSVGDVADVVAHYFVSFVSFAMYVFVSLHLCLRVFTIWACPFVVLINVCVPLIYVFL